MAQWILKANENVVPRRSHQPLQVAEIHSHSKVKKRKMFADLIEMRWGTSISLLILQLGEELLTGNVKCPALGPEGKIVGKYDDNPFLNSMTYEVEFVNGQVWEYSENVIAENMLTRVYLEGFSTTLTEGIVDCHKDELIVVMKADKYVYTKSGQWHLRKMMAGWDMLVRWKDQTESWI